MFACHVYPVTVKTKKAVYVYISRIQMRGVFVHMLYGANAYAVHACMHVFTSKHTYTSFTDTDTVHV